MEKQSSVDDYQNGKVNNHEFQVSVENFQEFSQLLHSQPNTESQASRRRKIQKLPPHIRRREKLYDPIMVSIGPYHHGLAEFRQAEEFKHLCLDRCAGGDEKKKALFYSKILEDIKAVRDSYAEVSVVEKYDDKSLALMMLLDASIIINFIHNFLDKKGKTFLDWQRCLGAGSGPLMVRDMLVMENQIPFHILKLLIGLQNEGEEEAAVLFIRRFFMEFLTYKTTEMEIKHADVLVRAENDDPALHLQEALWRVMAKTRKHIALMLPESSSSRIFQQPGFSLKEENVKSYAQRSVMDLKAKGVTLRPDSELSLRDIRFKPNIFFSQLHLPLLYITDLTPVIWSNMIAYEVSPAADGTNSLVFLSYGVFMKSLIQGPEDVKELQERGVLVNRHANLEKVVEMIKEIETFGLHDQDVFEDVKRRMEEHCRSRAKTWIADLIYTRFRTPWTALAFFAAVLLLCLTFLQTFFTIRPVKQRVK